MKWTNFTNIIKLMKIISLLFQLFFASNMINTATINYHMIYTVSSEQFSEINELSCRHYIKKYILQHVL